MLMSREKWKKIKAKMYLEVLEIDPDDEFALSQLIDLKIELKIISKKHILSSFEKTILAKPFCLVN